MMNSPRASHIVAALVLFAAPAGWVFSVSLWAANPDMPADTIDPATPELNEPTDATTPDSAAPEPTASEPDPTTAEPPKPTVAPISPSGQITGSIWRSKPGIVFLQTPIGPLSLSSKTTLKDVRGSQKITLWIHGATSVIDIREKGAESFVHRYITSLPNFTAREKDRVTLWTPDGEQTYALGPLKNAVTGRGDHLPFTVEVDRHGAIRGLHDVQFDMQVNQLPRTSGPLRLLLNGTVSKLKSNYIFLKTPLGIVTVNGKTGVRNAKVGQHMSVWIQDQHVAIDLYQDGPTTPARRFLSGPLTYASDERDALLMHTPEGALSIPLAVRPAALNGLKDGAMITVELSPDGALVELRRAS